MKHKHILISFILIAFLLSSTYSPTANFLEYSSQKSIVSMHDTCYGYLIPLPEPASISENPALHNSTLNLVNDLLRLQIPVYWLNQSLEAFVAKNSVSLDEQVFVFSKGTFMVPFTESNDLNQEIIAAITDYSLTHELHKDIEQVPSYVLLEPVTIESCFQLTEPNIAYYFGDGVYASSMNWYVSTLVNAGFLNHEFLDEQDVIESLNERSYNVFIWPGGNFENDFASNISLVSRVKKNQEVKKFVFEGGGFVGSCYGAYSASSGLRSIPLTRLRYYLPMIPSYSFLGLQDSNIALAISSSINVSIENTNYPITFGCKDTINGSEILGGCVYTKLGKNTQEIGRVNKVNNIVWYHIFRNLYSSNSTIAEKIIEYWSEFTTGKPIWTTSTYGKGKVVAFGDHPEAGDIHLQRIIHNTLLYVASQEQSQINVENFVLLSDIEEFKERSLNLSLSLPTTGFFDEINNQMQTMIHDLDMIQETMNTVFNKTWSLLEEEKIDIDFVIELFVSGIWEFSRTILRSIQYYNQSNSEENPYVYLDKIDRIGTQLINQDDSFEQRIVVFNLNISEKIQSTMESVNHMRSNVGFLKNEIFQYNQTYEQNTSIMKYCNQLLKQSKDIEKTLPNIYFDILIMLRELWYFYEASI